MIGKSPATRRPLSWDLGFRCECIANGHFVLDRCDPVGAVVIRRRVISKKLESGKAFLEPRAGLAAMLDLLLRCAL